MIRKYVKPTQERCRKRENCSIGLRLCAVMLAAGILFFVPTPSPRGEQQTQMTSVFDAVPKVISGGTAECESQWATNSGCRNPIDPTTCPMGGAGVFFSHRQELLPSSSQDRQEGHDIQQPEVKYNFSSHESADVLPVTAFEYQEQSPIIDNVKGRLRQHIEFWKSIDAYENIVDIIYNGYRIPFIETPSSKFFKNNRSALQNSKFVEEAILDLLRSGRIKESSEPPLVVNPLTISEN